MTLIKELLDIFGTSRVLERTIDLIAYAGDASFYRLIPKVVVQPISIKEIQQLFVLSQKFRVPMTFRAAGTSLSGQAISDGILVDITKSWQNIVVEENGFKVRVGTAVIGAKVNQKLKPFGRKIGPDPASINACMVGGIVANNSSGMCCGVAQNSYHTVESLIFVLPNGLTIDTAKPSADEYFRASCPEIANGLLELKRRIEADAVLSQKIRSKYLIKNTTGYSINAFLDFEKPVEILAHLLIGSEGTLGFVAETVFRTVPDFKLKYTGFLFFPTIQAACAAIIPLANSGAMAVELLDTTSIRSVCHLAGAPEIMREIPDNSVALLVEYQANSEENIARFRVKAEEVSFTFQLLEPPTWTEDPRRQMQFWTIRKGLVANIGALRPHGTSLLNEDVAFPVARLAEAITDLQALFIKHGYANGIIFGHAKDGNMHFVIPQSFSEPSAIQQMDEFMTDFAEIVVKKYDGSLKGEHGTGRNISAFVETEWGETAYKIMCELKSLIDPHGFLNPDVIINDDAKAHIHNLKVIPQVHQLIDECIECGYCESSCPSKNLTLTPRKRIAVHREMARLSVQSKQSKEILDSLEQDFQFDGMDTCATDGLCAIACPAKINTGDFVKFERARLHSQAAKDIALIAANNFDLVQKLARIGLRIGHFSVNFHGIRAVNALIRFIEKTTDMTIPKWNISMPRAAQPLAQTAQNGADAIFFPSCLTRTMQNGKSKLSDSELLLKIAEKAGVQLTIPQKVSSFCCGQSFESKGYDEAHREMTKRTINALWKWTEVGRLPVIIEASSCAYSLKTCGSVLSTDDFQKWQSMKFLDSIEFVHDELLPKLNLTKVREKSVLHPVCSVKKMGISEKFMATAQVCSESVEIPENFGCCGFAGDRGFLVPELTESATIAESEEVISGNFNGFYSSNLTCETGMTSATGKKYESFLHLVAKAAGIEY